MATHIRRLAYSILAGFVLMAAGLLYWQVIRAPELVARDDNPRLVQAELRLQRGRLLDRSGQVLAYSELLAGEKMDAPGGPLLQRRYPQPAAAHAVGYYSLRYGAGGAEAAFDTVLRGQLSPLDRLLHRPQAGHDAALSLDLAAQRAADAGLGDRRGAVVLLDIASGETLVLLSHPGYDPNRLDDDWDALSADPAAPLLNRATQGVYPVGDLARLIGLAGLLSAGITTPPDPLDAPLDAMLAPLSPRGYLATARQLGFDAAPPFDLPAGAGRLPDFGAQGTPRDLAVTPLHLARFAAALAGDGRMPVATLAHPALARPPDRAFAAGVAAALHDATPRLGKVAGWSGLATPQETGAGSLSWLVGYAPVNAPRLAVVVAVEDSAGGLAVTLPIAQQTLSAVQVDSWN